MKHSQKSRKEFERKQKHKNKIEQKNNNCVMPYDRKTGKINRSC